MDKVSLSKVTQNLDSRRKPLNRITRNGMKLNPRYPYYGANGQLDVIDEYIFDEEIICIAEDGGNWSKGSICSYIVNEKCWINNHAHVLKAKEDIDIRYLMYYLNDADLTSSITGTTRGKLTKSALSNLKIPFPPFQTQKKIVEVLDKAQELIDARKQQIKLLDDFIQSVFYDMFGDPVTNPKGWKRKLIEEISTMKSGGTPSRSKPEYFCGTIPWITTTALGDRYIDESYANEYITQKAIENSATKIIPKHSLIIGVRVGIGKVSINNCDICTNQDIVSLTEISSEVSLEFLWYQIKTYNAMLMNRKRGATIQGITSKVLKKLAIIFPPIHLQNQFAQKVQKIEQQKKLMQQSLIKMENNFNSLMQRAFKGELFKD